jgi:acyl-CoA synthetase (AMP-forming)/AMP-acid ligase II
MTLAPGSLPPTLLAHLTWWADTHPLREALVDELGRMNFGELQVQVRIWESALAAQGVRPGDRVAMLAPPGRESLVCFLATVALGAIWCGLDPRCQSQELEYRLCNLQARLVFTFKRIGTRDYPVEIAAILAQHTLHTQLVVVEDAPDDPFTTPSAGVTLASFLSQSGPVLAPSEVAPAIKSACTAAQPCVIVYTSGSSGVPKGAMLHEAGIVSFCLAQNALWPMDPLRTLNFLPISHVGSIVDLTLPTILAGGCVVFQRKFDALASLQLIATERVTFWGSVPSTFILQYALPQFHEINLGSLQIIAIEGAPIPAQLAEALGKIAPIATNYGMTETTSAITAIAPTRSMAELIDSVGSPMPDTEVRIAGAVAVGDVGEIEVRSPRCLLGYWRDSAASAAAFTADGYFRTGDLGAMLPDGRLRLAGRKKEMYKSGGYNVYPAEVEAVIAAHPGVQTVVVVAVPDPVWNEVGVAFFVAKDSAQGSMLIGELIRQCREKLADYKRPKQFVLLAELPLLPIGKVDRAALSARAVAAL